MAKEKFTIYLPCFPGFYNTVFEIQCESNADHADYDIIPRIEQLEHSLKTFDRPWAIEFYSEILNALPTQFDEDPTDAEEYVIEQFAELLEEHIKDDLGIDCNIIMRSLKQISPKEYNFTNDTIEADIEIDPKDLLDAVDRHLPEFDQYIKDNFTSYDGFISFVSNDHIDWLKDLERLARGEDTEEVDPRHIIQHVLQFLLLNNDRDYWMYYEYAYALDAPYCEFRPTRALTEFCEHPKVIEAVFKLIDEADKTSEYLKNKYPASWRDHFSKLFDKYVIDEVNELIDEYFEK